MKAIISRSLTASTILAFLVLALVPWHFVFTSEVSLGQMLQAPSLLHPFGTDNLGRDLLVRINQAMRDAVIPVWTVTGLATLLGFSIGGVAVLIPSRARSIFRFMLSIGVGIPIGILVFYVAVADEVITIRTLLVPLGVVMCLRSVLYILMRYERDISLGYWQANRSIGNAEIYRVFYYGFRQAWSAGLFSTLLFHLKIAVICEVGLSYLGFGLQEPKASFGNILASHFTNYLNGDLNVLLFVTLALWLTTSFTDCVPRLVNKLRTQSIFSSYSPPSTCSTSPVM